PGNLDDSIKAALKQESGKSYDPSNLTKEERAELRKALIETFGTPASPRVNVSLDDRYVGLLKLSYGKATAVPFNTEDHLAGGSELYRKPCMHCHGVPGDGRGPTGPWLHPHPRDYRQGVFKYKSSDSETKKPRFDDLRRTLQKGIDGTSMPAFGLL